jgi:hypothetical protein
MNFDEAVKAHAGWKMKLTTYLGKPDGSLKVAEIEVDNRCALGKWIHGEGAKYSSLPEFAELKAQHASFHKAAANIVTRADRGERNLTAETALGGNSEYSKCSSAVVGAIISMKHKASSSG